MNEQKIEQKQKMMDVILKWKKDFAENDKIHINLFKLIGSRMGDKT
jgi:hypothetical protein